MQDEEEEVVVVERQLFTQFWLAHSGAGGLRHQAATLLRTCLTL